MRQRALLVVMTVVLLLSAAPASAQGWRWLEKLSGPGDFYGYEVNVKVFCHYEEVSPEDRKASERFVPAISMPCVFKTAARPNKDRKPTPQPPAGDPRDSVRPEHPYYAELKDKSVVDLSRRIDALGVGVSYLRGSGDLEYAPTVEHVDRTVQLWAFEAFYDRKLPTSDRVDYGVAAGANLFVVPEADTFVRLSVEPRLTIKLFDLRKRDLYVGTASLRLGALFLFGRFEDVDFGAIPGTYQSAKVDVGPSFRLVLDFDRNPFK
jgi:hypothetical protein